MKSYFMGIDIGTYESKGVIIDDNAAVVACAAIPHKMECPKPGYAEHDAEKVWWHDFCKLSNGLISDSGIHPRQIAAVGCSTIAPCCLPVDRDLRPLRKAILYGVDVRVGKEIKYLEDLFGKDAIFQKCGTPVTSQAVGAKLLWIKNNEPEIHKSAYKFLTGSSYLVAKLTGKFAIDRYTAACWVPLYNISSNDWEEDVSLFCRRDQLAECYWSNEIVGCVNAQASKETGLPVGTPVITGTADASAEALSVGVLRPGNLMLMYGSSIFIIHVVDKLTTDPRIWAGPYLFENTYSMAAGMSTSGTLTRWYKEQFARDLAELAVQRGENEYSFIAKAAEHIPPGSDGLIVLPYFSGERTPINDVDAKGMIFGLNLSHTREHIYRACLEGIGYGISQHFDIFRERGVATNKIMAVGGGTKNREWIQIVSDVCQETQYMAKEKIGAAYGDSLLAALAVGFYPSLEALENKIQIEKSVTPNHELQALYACARKKYDLLYKNTKEIMHMR